MNNIEIIFGKILESSTALKIGENLKVKLIKEDKSQKMLSIFLRTHLR